MVTGSLAGDVFPAGEMKTELPAQLRGQVMTVEGPLDPAELGVTLTHEHLFIDQAAWLMPATDAGIAALADERVSLESLWWVRRFPSSSRDNLLLDDYETACREIGYYIAEGGRTLVDVTPTDLIGDRRDLLRVARDTGVQIVASTGYYAYVTRPAGFDERTVESLADEFVRDVVEGFPGSGIHAGLIGELAIEGGHDERADGMPWGMRSIDDLGAGDEKLLRAAARAQRRCGAAISIHPPAAAIRGIGASAVIHGILDIVAEEGADLRRVVIGHLDRDRWETVDSLASLAARGPYLEFDQWGYEGIIQNSWVFPSDDDRIRLTRGLIGEGLVDRLLWSHDVCEKRMWRRFGGQGYGHILRFVVPVLREHGVSQATIDQILVRNPAEMLALCPAGEVLT